MALPPALRALYRSLPLAEYVKRPARDLYELMCRRSHDGFVLAHPNTGSTMITISLARYFQLHSKTEKFRFFHDNYWTLGRKAGFNYYEPFGKVSSTHLPHRIDSMASSFTFEACIAPYRESKIVLVIRNPLEALLSNWLHHATVAEKPLADKFREIYAAPLAPACFDSVVLGGHGLPASIAYYNQYAANRRDLRLKLVRFEDCKQSRSALLSEISSILSFLSDGKHSVNPSYLDEAADFSSVENIKNSEFSGVFVDDAGVDMAGGYNTLQNSLPHQVDGHTGSYADYYLSPETKAAALAYMDEHLDPYYGYCAGIAISRSNGG